MASIEKAVEWALQIAADDSHGYDQGDRDGPDYDCSSFVGHALKYGGFNVNPLMTTRTAKSELTKVGFTTIGLLDERKRGDIFLVNREAAHHIVLCINSSQIVHASINEKGTITGGKPGDQTGNEICVRYFYTPKGGWTDHFRPPTDSTDTTAKWIAKNAYLGETEMQNNARMTYNYLSARGWTLNAIAGALGNFHRESTINPGIYQNLSTNPKLGYGLAQWTPADTKILKYCKDHGYSVTNGDYQLKYLDEETDKLHFWVQRGYPITFSQYKSSTESAEYLALAFCYNYENAGVTADEERKRNARKWYNFLQGYTPPVTPVEPNMPYEPDEEHKIVVDIDSPDMEHPDYEYYNNVYRRLLNTSYNISTLSAAEVHKFKWIIVTDRVTLPATFDRDKRTFGTDFYGKRLHMVHEDYKIKGIRNDGFFILQYKNEPCVIYIEPHRIGVSIPRSVT